ncbi:hypothetical protein LOK49_LG14G02277 [Camellia lanceoleosa]|uniref:Uncharacterized protein n=1 Tax=Camellia lanceoleosa TaxID=1840588 RepID=A0ACC0FC35_9ERIC|nr:hypothetical protein LOK49_LG14G02277 [Camellia lanceoleosa]
MDFFKVKKFRKAHKPNPEKESEDEPVPQPEEPKNDKGDEVGKPANVDPSAEAEDDDDDFITNEVKRRLKELRRNSFMVLIPEESGMEGEEEEEEEAETSSSELRDVEAEGQQPWCGIDAVYGKYCDQMLFFDRLSAQQLNEVAQVCLTWEALHSHYTQLSQKISCQPENSTCYNHSAQQFQQFLVLLQRYIENEPFEQGFRAEIYARSRNSMPKLLQVPNIQEFNSHFPPFPEDGQEKSSGVKNLFGGQNQLATPLQQIKSALEKKEMKLKELQKRMKGWKKKSWPATQEEAELLLGLIDVKVMSRVLRLVRITKEQLFWCEEKMKKLDLSDGKLQRDPSPILFPC